MLIGAGGRYKVSKNMDYKEDFKMKEYRFIKALTLSLATESGHIRRYFESLLPILDEVNRID